MKKASFVPIFLFYTLFLFSGSHAFGDEDKTIRLGGKEGWGLAAERRAVGEYDGIRPLRVLALSSALQADDPGMDAALSFDEEKPALFRDLTGHYRLETGTGISGSGRDLARSGNGAARFSGGIYSGSSVNEGPLLIIPAAREALLFPGQTFRDFSIEFWLYPMNAENGEQILSWVSTRQTARGESAFQRMQCVVMKSRLQWNFTDFFFSPDDKQHSSFSVTSLNLLVPRTWSHHLIRFDSGTGRIEYLVNGKAEGIVYASSTGREGGDVYFPIIGEGGRLALGGRYTGFIDEFRIYGRYLEDADTSKFPRSGGSFRTAPINLGSTNSRVKKIDISSGLTSASAGTTKNTYSGSNVYKFPNNAALHFFARASDNPYQWAYDDSGWISFVPGSDLPESLRGKWLQVMVDMYPSGDRESSPYIDEMLISYARDSAPPPPAMVQAIARDGAVDLSWRASSDDDVGGYLLYYGTSAGEYFGESAILGVSPVDAGKRTSIRIDGLENGTLYYFAVAAYDQANPPHIGEFSREVSARPLRMVQ